MNAVPVKASVLFLAMALVLSFAASAAADVVSGQVYAADGSLAANQTFRVLQDKDRVVTTFRTDGSGHFSVYLEQGAYRVRPEGSDEFEGSLTSYPQPVRQDVRLRRR